MERKQKVSETSADPVEQPEVAAQLPEEPVLLPPRGLVVALIVALLATAGLAVVRAPPAQDTTTPSLQLTTWLGNDVEMQAIVARDDALLKNLAAMPPESRAHIAQVRDLLKQYLALENQLGAQDLAYVPQAREKLGDLEEAVRALVLQRGPDALRGLAVAYGRDVAQAFENVLNAAAARHVDLTALLQEQPLPAEVSQLTAVAGGIGRALAPAQLTDQMEQGHLRLAASLAIQALAQQRVFQLGVRIRQGGPQLPSDTHLLLLRFRVEAYEGTDLPRKFQLLREIDAIDPSYPGTYVGAVLLARAGQFRDAQSRFMLAAARGQGGKLARANARWCQEK